MALSRLQAERLKRLATEAAQVAGTATALAFFGERAATRSRAGGLRGLGQTVLDIGPGSRINVPALTNRDPPELTPKKFKDPFKPGMSAGLIYDDLENNAVLINIPSGMDPIRGRKPAVKDWSNYNLSREELAVIRDHEIAWAELGGMFKGGAQDRTGMTFYDYIGLHAPGLEKKLRAGPVYSGRRAAIRWDATDGVDWNKVGKVIALAALAYFGGAALAGGGGAGPGAGAAASGGSAAGSSAAGSAAALKPIAVTAAKLPVAAGAGVVMPSVVPAAAGVATMPAASSIASVSGAVSQAAAAGQSASRAASIVTKAKAIAPKVVKAVNAARTVEAVANGEMPPPPVELEGDNFKEWGASLAEQYLERRVSERGEQMAEAERALAEQQIRNEMERLQREAQARLPGPSRDYIDPPRGVIEAQQAGLSAQHERWLKWGVAAAALTIVAAAATQDQRRAER